MTTFKILKENADQSTTDKAIEIAKRAERCAPCSILITGEGIPSSGHADGVKIDIHADEPWDRILHRVEYVRAYFEGG